MRVFVVLGDTQLLWNCPQESKLLSLKDFISSTMNLNVHDFMISWKDEEEDNITILREEDINLALNIAIEDNRKDIKFYVMTKLNIDTEERERERDREIEIEIEIEIDIDIEIEGEETDERGESIDSILNSKSSDEKFGESIEFTPIFEENNNKELLSLLTTSLNDIYRKNEIILSTLITKIELDNKKYFILSFKAIQCVFTKIMIDKLGHNVIKPLFIHCNSKQKLILINNLSHNIVPIACHKYGYLSIITIIDLLLSHDNDDILIFHLITALIDNIKILTSVEYGVRLLVTLFDKQLQGEPEPETEADNYFINLAHTITKYTNILIKHQYGWFILYKFLRCDAPITITNQIKQEIQNNYHEYCKHEWAAKVVEQCLRHSIHTNKKEFADFATIIVKEILTKPDDLVDDQYGKHVFHLALLSQVNGINGDNLYTLKNNANILYEKHIKQIRRKKKQEDEEEEEEDEDEEEDDDHHIYTSNFDIYYHENQMKNDILQYVQYPQFS